jgi:hypothetical protein
MRTYTRQFLWVGDRVRRATGSRCVECGSQFIISMLLQWPAQPVFACSSQTTRLRRLDRCWAAQHSSESRAPEKGMATAHAAHPRTESRRFLVTVWIHRPPPLFRKVAPNMAYMSSDAGRGPMTVAGGCAAGPYFQARNTCAKADSHCFLNIG